MRGAHARWGVIAAGILGLAALAACPPTNPPITPPADADAARPPRPPVHVGCKASATHYAKVCATADEEVVEGLCTSIFPNLPSYSDCMAKAASCDDGTACDNVAAVNSTKRPVNGR